MTMTKAQGFIEGARRDRQSVTADWTAVGRELIRGVEVVESRSIPKRAGFLTEIFRRDWFAEQTVDQVFQVVVAPGSVSAWHAHRDTTDRLFVASGSITLALYDARSGSPTEGRVNELHLTIARPQLVVIPPGVWHGLIATGATAAIILNLADRAYTYEDPDHWRLPPDTPEIPYLFANTGDALVG
jgi:dTDP-4-dehydrorhamnose 3,5-epimerase